MKEEEFQKKVISKLNGIEKRLRNIEKRLDEIESNMSSVYEGFDEGEEYEEEALPEENESSARILSHKDIKGYI